jgi:hypothetical protein
LNYTTNEEIGNLTLYQLRKEREALNKILSMENGEGDEGGSEPAAANSASSTKPIDCDKISDKAFAVICGGLGMEVVKKDNKKTKTKDKR